jgi:aryl-alcohol dehydrogenase-like predicted oxidoreductase
MNYRRLGRSGLKISEISLGSWLTYGGTVDAAASRKVILAAWEAGINFFDTADVYSRGEAEVVLGQVLPELPRNEVAVATKVMGRVWDGPYGAGLSRKHVMDAADASLKRLGLDYIDLYQAHAPDDGTPLEETLSAFNDLVRSGRVRYLGVSNFSTEQHVECQRICERNGWERIVSSQPCYNLLDRAVEPALIPRCREEGIGLIVYSPLAQGILTGKYGRGGKPPKGSRATTKAAVFMEKWMAPELLKKVAVLEKVARRRGKKPAQVALAWILEQQTVSSAIVGATTAEQVRENVKASAIKLTAKDREELEAAFPVTGSPV